MSDAHGRQAGGNEDVVWINFLNKDHQALALGIFDLIIPVASPGIGQLFYRDISYPPPECL